tara:strand:+ start:101 stop:301 length:201 start_codon:yes stop_codon:yes gene_type:complete
MPIIQNNGKALGGKPERISFNIEETDFLIKVLSEIQIPIAQAKLAWSTIEKITVIHKRLMGKTTEI